MLENLFVFHLITQLFTLLATVMLLFGEPQNSSKNTWIANVENKQEEKVVREAKVRWKLLLCLFCRSEKTRRGCFSFHNPLSNLVYHVPCSVHTKMERHKTKDVISSSLCLILLKSVWWARLKSQRNFARKVPSGGWSGPIHTHSRGFCQKKFFKYGLNILLLQFLHILKI